MEYIALAMAHIRFATPQDYFAIGELLVEAYVSAYARKAPELTVPEWRRAELRDVASRHAHAAILVAQKDEKEDEKDEDTGRIVGTIALYKPGAPGSEAWLPGFADLRHMATLPEMQGRGLSKLLLDRTEQLAREEWRCPGISLHVRKGVSGLAKLYEARGYVREPAGDLVRHGDVVLHAFVLRF